MFRLFDFNRDGKTSIAENLIGMMLGMGEMDEKADDPFSDDLDVTDTGQDDDAERNEEAEDDDPNFDADDEFDEDDEEENGIY